MAAAARRVIPAAALKASLALPRTGFPMRANAAAREPAHADRLTTALYARQLARRRGRAEWALHDGPPYANGALHMGHFLNKVLKDVINRRALVEGRRVVFVPGWDCHGLPIELKVLSELRERHRGAPPPRLSPLGVRRLAAASATDAIAGQAADFRRWGVLADWAGVQRWVADARAATADARARSAVGAGDEGAAGEAPAAATLPSPAASPATATPPALYVTMTPAYEAAQLRLWGAMVARGHVCRALKPVHWSPSSQTALAEAELEYADAHVSPSVFVTFPLASCAWAADARVADALRPLCLDAAAVAAATAAGTTTGDGLAGGGGVLEAAGPAYEQPFGGVLEAAVWTTTPWTLPANVALAVSDGGAIRYSVVAAAAASGPSPLAEGATSGRSARRHFLVATPRIPELQRVLRAAAAAAHPPGNGGSDASDKGSDASWELTEVLGGLTGSQLQGLLFAHPFLPTPLALGGRGAGVPPASASSDSTSTTMAGELHLVVVADPSPPSLPSAASPGENAPLQQRCQHRLLVVAADGDPVPPGSRRVSPIVTGPAVTSDSGTGIVHTAPGHGMDDFDVCTASRDALASLLGAQPADTRGGISGAPPSVAEPPLQPQQLLPVLCPVDDLGRFTSAAGLSLAGQHVLKEGTASVLAMLHACGSLLHSEPFTHRYPYDWRSKQPVIVRATLQWFVRLAASAAGSAAGEAETRAGEAAGDVLPRALAALERVRFTPPSGRARLAATVGARREWCVSRQRAWGVPIPALYVAGGPDGVTVSVPGEEGVVLRRGDAYMTPASVAHVACLVAAQGADAWWTLPVEQLALPHVHAAVVASGMTLVRGADTLDVWLDSGASWAAAWGGYAAAAPPTSTEAGCAPSTEGAQAGCATVPASAPSPLGRPSDMVLEGSDQHRGWFQSSLLTAVAAAPLGCGDDVTAAAPYAAVVTHGFVLDERQRKMSKSLGNVIAPGDIIDGKAAAAKGAGSGGGGGGSAGKEGVGVDVLRLWAASADYARDCAIGPGVLATVGEAARKLRNTTRFLLASQVTAPTAAATAAVAAAAPSPEEAMLAAWSAPVLAGPHHATAAASAPAASSSQRGGTGLQPLPAGLPLVETLLLHRLAALQAEVEGGYRSLSFQRVTAALANAASTELSSVFFDAVKDPLYCDPPDDVVPAAIAASRAPVRLSRRAAAQLVLWEATRVLVRAMAPILPFTAEEVFQHSAEFVLLPPQLPLCASAAAVRGPPECGGGAAAVMVPGVTVFDASIPLLPSEWAGGSSSSGAGTGVVAPAGQQPAESATPAGTGDAAADAAAACATVQLPGVPVPVPAAVAWDALTWLRGECNRLLEAARQGRDIGASTEARVTLTLPAATPCHDEGGAPSPVDVLHGVVARLLDEGAAGDALLASQVSLGVRGQSGDDEGGSNARGASLSAAGPSGGGVSGVSRTGGQLGERGWAYTVQLTLPSFGLWGTPGAGTDPAASTSSAPATVGIQVSAAVGGRCVRCRRHAPEVAVDAATANPTRSGGRDGGASALDVDSSCICTRCQRALDATGAW